MSVTTLSLSPSLAGLADDCDVPEGALVARLAGVTLYINLLTEEAYIETEPDFSFDCLSRAELLAQVLHHEPMQGYEAMEEYEDGRVRHWLECVSDIAEIAEKIQEGKELVA